jgi:hypothetical protein
VIPRELARPGARSDGPPPAGRAERPRDSHVTGPAASAFAPAAHGGRPPVRYPGHCPSPADRRHVRRGRPHGKGRPPGAPVLSRGRSPSRAPPAAPSLRDALRAPWTVNSLGSNRHLSEGRGSAEDGHSGTAVARSMGGCHSLPRRTGTDRCCRWIAAPIPAPQQDTTITGRRAGEPSKQA